MDIQQYLPTCMCVCSDMHSSVYVIIILKIPSFDILVCICYNNKRKTQCLKCYFFPLLLQEDSNLLTFSQKMPILVQQTLFLIAISEILKHVKTDQKILAVAGKTIAPRWTLRANIRAEVKTSCPQITETRHKTYLSELN